jgi:hypothetical protein
MDSVHVVAVKVREIEEIFAEAGPQRDLRRVKRFGGDARLALRNVRLKNAELEALADELEKPDLKSLRALFGAPADEPEALGDYHRLRVRSVPLAPLGGGL